MRAAEARSEGQARPAGRSHRPAGGACVAFVVALAQNGRATASTTTAIMITVGTSFIQR